jgi:hypothetical protein
MSWLLAHWPVALLALVFATSWTFILTFEDDRD